MPKIVDHEVRRNELADVTLEIIAEQGIKAVTTRSVASRSGWSTGVINHYFDSHHDLLVGALRRAAEVQGQMYREVRERDAHDPMACLKDLTESVLPLDERRLAMNRIFLVFYAEASANPDAHAEVVDYLRNWRRVVERVIAEGQSVGQIPAELDPSDLAVELVGLADGVAMHAMLDPDVLKRFIDTDGINLDLINGSWRLATS